MRKFQVYKNNVNAILNLKRQGRWSNNQNLTSYIFWYTYKFIITNIKN